jgi:hypothetical protein
MLTPHGSTFQIKARGQTWSGIWRQDGREVCVSSAFGSERRQVGRRKPDLVAQAILADLVERWAQAER